MDFRLIDTHHEEVIHDIAFDHFGKRFATCSSDSTVKVYGKQPNGQWLKQDEIKCHDGPVWRVVWASPRFGSVLATCSHDKSVCIWEESTSSSGETKWEKRDKIIDTRESVQDIKFSNNKIDLTLAIASADGNLQIYEIVENHSQHQNKGEVLANPYGIRSISWNKAHSFEPQMIAVGGNSFDDRFYKITQLGLNGLNKGNQSRITLQTQMVNPTFVEEQAAKNTLTIFGKQENNKGQNCNWVAIKHFEQYRTVNDVSWANLNGRSFHLLAAADCTGAKVWKFRVKQNSVEILEQMNIDQTPIEVWRVSWNMLATHFAASQISQEVEVYKNINNIWVCQSTFKETQERQDAG